MSKKGQKYKKYSHELKVTVVQESLNGVSNKELVKKYNIKNDTQVETWLRKYREEGFEGLRKKKIGRKPKTSEQSEIEQLRMENEVLKKIQDLLEQEKP